MPELAEPPGESLGDEEFRTLCVRYLEAGIEAGDIQLLEREIESSADRRATFVKICSLRARVIEHLRGPGEAPEQDPSGSEDGPSRPVASPVDLHDAMILPAIASDPRQADADDEQLAHAPLTPAPAWRDPRLKVGLLRRPWIRAASIALICAGVIGYALRPTRETTSVSNQPVRGTTSGTNARARLIASLDAEWSDRGVRVGELLPDMTASLEQGMVEIRLENGVNVVVQAPAVLRVNSPEELELQAGKLAVTVPAKALGFAVQTPTARIVDLGTEFGVTAEEGQSEAVVFRGSVRANTSTNGAGDAAAAAAIFTAGQGVRINASGMTSLPADAARESSAQYVRDIRVVRQPVKMFSTGQAMDPEKGIDTKWQLAWRSDRPDEKPSPLVPSFDPNYVANDASSQWISASRGARSDSGARFTFRTSFDLTGFDPKTMRLVLRLSADDSIEDVLLNGTSTGIRLAQYNSKRLTEFVVDKGFVEGRNQLDVSLMNIGERGLGSIFALRAKLEGSAVRRVESVDLP